MTPASLQTLPEATIKFPFSVQHAFDDGAALHRGKVKPVYLPLFQTQSISPLGPLVGVAAVADGVWDDAVFMEYLREDGCWPCLFESAQIEQGAEKRAL